MHWARSCATLLALTLPVEAKIGDNLRIRKLRIRYRAELLGHLTPKRAAFSGADTSQMNLRGQGTTGKPNFFNVNRILMEIFKYLTFIFRDISPPSSTVYPLPPDWFRFLLVFLLGWR